MASPIVHPYARYKRTILLLAAGALLIVLVAAALAMAYARQHIGFAQKCSGDKCWGYELSKHRFTGQYELRFQGSWGLDISYKLPDGWVERSSEHWLATDRAIVLDLRWKENFDAPRSTPIHVLYDFQRGELMLQSPLAVWRLPDYRSGKPSKNWLTEEQFRIAREAIEP